LFFSCYEKDISKCNIFIITVPTPIDKYKKPDLSSLKQASQIVGKYLKKKDLVIFESTVFPGATEEICNPILEKRSKLKLNKDFYIGYSPERLSSGDAKHGLKKIVKITSGSNKLAANMVNNLYKSIIPKGTYLVSSIKVAESAKVIENIQRDVNIALINEFAINFSKLGIKTNEVLKAAGTKWNFAKFLPGLVGGHCIAVDPYYLYHKAKRVGYNNKLIPISRKINDDMSSFVVKRFLSVLKETKTISRFKVLIMGLAFKENSSDTRNSPVFHIYRLLKRKKCIKNIHIYDPLVKINSFKNKIKMISKLKIKYDGIIVAVPHNVILSKYYKENKKFTHDNTKVFDIKYVIKPEKRVFPL